MVDVNDPVFHVQIADRQSAELGNSHPRVEQDVNCLVVFAVAVIVMYELQEFPHLVPGDGLPCYAIVNHHTGKLKPEGILLQAVIIDRHLESRPENAPDRLHAAVPPAITLELDQEKFSIGKKTDACLYCSKI